MSACWSMPRPAASAWPRSSSRSIWAPRCSAPRAPASGTPCATTASPTTGSRPRARWSSRSAFLAATGGRGVDVVLDSLAGDFVDASLRLMAPRRPVPGDGQDRRPGRRPGRRGARRRRLPGVRPVRGRSGPDRRDAAGPPRPVRPAVRCGRCRSRLGRAARAPAAFRHMAAGPARRQGRADRARAARPATARS